MIICVRKWSSGREVIWKLILRLRNFFYFPHEPAIAPGSIFRLFDEKCRIIAYEIEMNSYPNEIVCNLFGGAIGSRLDKFFQQDNGFVEVNPGNVIMPRKYADICNEILESKVREDDVWMISYPRTGVFAYPVRCTVNEAPSHMYFSFMEQVRHGHRKWFGFWAIIWIMKEPKIFKRYVLHC